MSKENKPLGRKIYGSIPHLKGSRMGPSEHHIHEGQEHIATVKARKGDVVIVTEKLDGSCTSVANIDGNIVALGRAGYLANTSRFEMHHMFADWVDGRKYLFEECLEPGQRLVGEWTAQAHGTKYSSLVGPWAPFDLMEGKQRYTYADMQDCIDGFFGPVPVIGIGPAISIESALETLGSHGEYGAELSEGAVWRVETNGEFNFICKYVRPEKKDGIYLPEISGKEAVWNWRP